MADELRTPLVPAAETFTRDLVVGRHGDPHVAFAVLVYPDEPPAIIALSPAGSTDISRIHSTTDAEPPSGGKPRFFTAADLNDAAQALQDADIALRMSGWAASQAERDGKEFHLGRHVVEQVAAMWQRRRDNRVRMALEKAAEDARRPAVCPHCGDRFTERGIKQHLARAPWCRRQEAAQREATS